MRRALLDGHGGQGSEDVGICLAAAKESRGRPATNSVVSAGDGFPQLLHDLMLHLHRVDARRSKLSGALAGPGKTAVPNVILATEREVGQG